MIQLQGSNTAERPQLSRFLPQKPTQELDKRIVAVTVEKCGA